MCEADRFRIVENHSAEWNELVEQGWRTHTALEVQEKYGEQPQAGALLRVLDAFIRTVDPTDTHLVRMIWCPKSLAPR